MSIYHSIKTDQEADKFVSSLVARLGDLSASISRGTDSIKIILELKDRLKAITIPLSIYVTYGSYSRSSTYPSLLLCSSLYLCDLHRAAMEIAHTLSDNSFSDMQNVLYRMILSCLGISEYDFDTNDMYQLRKTAYECGTPRELLLSDVIVAVMKKHYSV